MSGRLQMEQHMDGWWSSTRDQELVGQPDWEEDRKATRRKRREGFLKVERREDGESGASIFDDHRQLLTASLHHPPSSSSLFLCQVSSAASSAVAFRLQQSPEPPPPPPSFSSLYLHSCLSFPYGAQVFLLSSPNVLLSLPPHLLSFFLLRSRGASFSLNN